MKTITSFKINHLTHNAGIYLSRQDGEIYTYDVRICKPYVDELMTNAEMHSLEHLLATILRDEYDDVVYVGPMGCQTGFYVLFNGVSLNEAKNRIIKAFITIKDYEGEMPGNSEIMCGNCHNLSVSKAKAIASIFLKRINAI